MRTLVLLRHGESEWNAKGLFTGWVDVGLSATGAQEAVSGGKLLAQSGLRPAVVHTSVLTRAIQTANIALEEAGQPGRQVPGPGRRRRSGRGGKEPGPLGNRQGPSRPIGRKPGTKGCLPRGEQASNIAGAGPRALLPAWCYRIP